MEYYLFAIINNIRGTLNACAWFTGAVGFIFLIISFVANGSLNGYSSEEDRAFAQYVKILCKRFITVFAISATFVTFIPSQKQLAFIIAAPYIVENEDLQQASKNTAEIVKLGTEYLKEILNDSNGTDKNS